MAPVSPKHIQHFFFKKFLFHPAQGHRNRSNICVVSPILGYESTTKDSKIAGCFLKLPPPWCVRGGCPSSLPGKMAALRCLFPLSPCWEMLTPVCIGILTQKHSPRLDLNGKQWLNAGGASPALSYGGRNSNEVSSQHGSSMDVFLPSHSSTAAIGVGNKTHHGGSSPGTYSLRSVCGEDPPPSPAHMDRPCTDVSSELYSVCAFLK